MIAFIQACGLGANDHGGSPKIFRSLLDTNHPPVLSVNTHFSAVSLLAGRDEVQIPQRPNLGRLERTRLSGSFGFLDWLWSGSFERRLRRVLKERNVQAIHLLANSYSIVPVHRVATELGIPYFINAHDDLEYASKDYWMLRRMSAALGRAWREAAGVFVISNELGEEYNRRFGARDYRVVTDGLKRVADRPLPRPANSLRLYFMGLFHNSYARNLRAVLDALNILRSQNPDWQISVACRCEVISTPMRGGDVPVTVLPYAPESEVERDLLSADVLYQPLPFQQEARAFSRFSMSTKMITYLGSGLPIFYHGPADAAAGVLLKKHEAASVCATLEPETIARELGVALKRREAIVDNALALARSQFMVADQQRRFWEPIVAALD